MPREINVVKAHSHLTTEVKHGKLENAFTYRATDEYAKAFGPSLFKGIMLYISPYFSLRQLGITNYFIAKISAYGLIRCCGKFIGIIITVLKHTYI
jgi:hypothetical protein